MKAKHQSAEKTTDVIFLLVFVHVLVDTYTKLIIRYLTSNSILVTMIQPNLYDVSFRIA